jgi:glycosyltransferase involved in cell wall biosynthesis
MKLIIQIPCFNEENNLATTFQDLPKKIQGIDTIETLIIDDGSTDRTADVARKMGVDHILMFNRHKGLARAFSAGIEKCLELGADVIVNTDGDNQYAGRDIGKLVKPILEGKADVVVGTRPLATAQQFSWFKKMLLRRGSAVIRVLSQTAVKDTVSGFRAFSRDAAIRINILTEYSYTVENLIQLGHQKMQVLSVPIQINEQTRKSRLVKSIPHFVGQQFATLVRVYASYKALKVFTILGLFFILPGLFGFLRFLYFYLIRGGQGHIQSLIFSTVFLLVGFLIVIFGILADLIGTNRKLTEKALYKLKKLELENLNRKKNDD